MDGPARMQESGLIDDRSGRVWTWFVTACVLIAGVSAARATWSMENRRTDGTVGVVASVGLAWRWPAPASTFEGTAQGMPGRSFVLARPSVPSSDRLPDLVLLSDRAFEREPTERSTGRVTAGTRFSRLVSVLADVRPLA